MTEARLGAPPAIRRDRAAEDADSCHPSVTESVSRVADATRLVPSSFTFVATRRAPPNTEASRSKISRNDEERQRGGLCWRGNSLGERIELSSRWWMGSRAKSRAVPAWCNTGSLQWRLVDQPAVWHSRIPWGSGERSRDRRHCGVPPGILLDDRHGRRHIGHVQTVRTVGKLEGTRG